jgi:hypothetical protein
MKRLLILLLMFAWLPTIAQITAQPSRLIIQPSQKVIDDSIASRNSKSWRAIKTSTAENHAPINVFIDSVKFSENILTYIGPNAINSIDVNKDSKYPNGVIWIKLKDHAILEKLLTDKWLSLSDIAKENLESSERNKPVLYLLNDKLLTDTTGIRIPSLCVSKVMVTKASETNYFKTVLPNVLLMMITTTTFPKPDPAQIRLRGNESK